MKRAFLFLIGVSFVGLSHATGAFLPYVPSTNTYQSSAVVNLASGTIRNLNLGVDFKIYNVLNYGVVADSATFCDTLVNSLITSTVATAGGNIYFPPGDYAVGDGNGINITRSDINLIFAPGAWLHKWGTGGAITVGRQNGLTVNRIGIYGARITSTSTEFPNAGIAVTPDSNNSVNYLTIKDFLITGMSQYGIEGGGTIQHMYVLDGAVYNNGASTESWVSQAYDVFPLKPNSRDFVAQNVYFQQTKTPAASAETDGCKIQAFDGVRISNLTAEGGGSSVVTGASLILSDNSNMTATNLHVVNNSNGTGFIISTSSSDPGSLIDVVTTSGTFGSDLALYFGSGGTHNLHLSHLQSNGTFACVISSHSNLTVDNSNIADGFTMSLATFTNSTISHLETNGTIQINGIETKVLNCTSYKRSGGADAFLFSGTSMTVRDNTAIQPSAYCYRVSGSSIVLEGNACINPVSGAYIISAGATCTVIEQSYGQSDITDSGTSTVLPYISSATSTSGGLVPTSGVFFDVISTFTLTPGSWDLWGNVIYSANGATFTNTDMESCIATAPGSGTTGCNDGQNYNYTSAVVPTSFTHFTPAPVHLHVSITTPTKYFLKGYIQTFTVGNPKVRGSLWALRGP